MGYILKVDTRAFQACMGHGELGDPPQNLLRGEVGGIKDCQDFGPILASCLAVFECFPGQTT